MIDRIKAKLLSMLLRAIVTESSDAEGIPLVKIKTVGGRNLSEIEYMQPAGVSFRVPTDAEGMLVCPTAQISNAVLICASSRSDSPSGNGINENEGGLHYAGAYKVFLASDGTLHLGALSADDWVPLDSALQTELARIKSDIQAIVDLLSGSGSTPWVVVPTDGGAALQTAAATALSSVPSNPGTTASTTTRVQS